MASAGPYALCKSAPRSRQITMPAPHHSVFYRPDALPAAQPTASKHWMWLFWVCDKRWVSNLDRSNSREVLGQQFLRDGLRQSFDEHRVIQELTRSSTVLTTTRTTCKDHPQCSVNMAGPIWSWTVIVQQCLTHSSNCIWHWSDTDIDHDV